jgi:hypothetical protein
MPAILKYTPFGYKIAHKLAAQDLQKKTMGLQVQMEAQKMKQANAMLEYYQGLTSDRKYQFVSLGPGKGTLVFDQSKIGQEGYVPELVGSKNVLSPEGLQEIAASFRAKIGEETWNSSAFQTGLSAAIANAKTNGEETKLYEFFTTWASKAMGQEMRPEPNTSETRFVENWLAVHNKPQTPANMLEAQRAYIQETKTNPAMVVAESKGRSFGQTRGIQVYDKDAGEVVYMSWDDYNRESKATPGRLVAPQYAAETAGLPAAGREFAIGTEADQIQSFRTFLGHADDLSNYVNEIRNTGQPWINRPFNWLRRQTGNPQIQSYLAKIQPVRDEFTSFLLNNRAMHEKDREAALKIVDENLSPAQMQSVIKSMAHTADIRLGTLARKYRDIYGKEKPGIYDEETTRILDKFGMRKRGLTKPKTSGYSPEAQKLLEKYNIPVR